MPPDQKKKIIISTICLAVFVILFVVFMVPIRNKIAANYLAKADGYYLERNWQEAEKFYQKVLWWNSRNENSIYFKLGVSQYNLNEYDLAIKSYQNSLRDPKVDALAVLNNIANSWREKGEYAKALDLYNLIIEQIKLNKGSFKKNTFFNKIGTLVLMNSCQEAKDSSDKIVSDYKAYFSQEEFKSILKSCEKKS